MQVVGSQPLVVAITGGDVERREVRLAGADPQHIPVPQPVLVLGLQLNPQAQQLGAPQQAEVGGFRGLAPQRKHNQQQREQAHGKNQIKALRLANSTSSISERAFSFNSKRVL
ncbi:hypothetical protein FQZ97_1262050 [compost metagenome]